MTFEEDDVSSRISISTRKHDDQTPPPRLQQVRDRCERAERSENSGVTACSRSTGCPSCLRSTFTSTDTAGVIAGDTPHRQVERL